MASGKAIQGLHHRYSSSAPPQKSLNHVDKSLNPADTSTNYAATLFNHTDTSLIHADKIGVRLKSPIRRKNILRASTGQFDLKPPLNFRYKPSGKGNVPASAWTNSPLTSDLVTRSSTMYISNMVTPLQSAKQNIKPRKGCASAPVLKSHSDRLFWTGSHDSSIDDNNEFSDQSMSSEPPEHLLLRKYYGTSRLNNKSNQSLRYEAEQDQKSKARQLMTSSQVQSHRVNRLYVMAGTKLSIQPRFDVDDDELDKLRALKEDREGTNYYGRGLRLNRKKIDQFLGSDIPIPRQPPPSQLDMTDDQISTSTAGPQLSTPLFLTESGVREDEDDSNDERRLVPNTVNLTLEMSEDSGRTGISNTKGGADQKSTKIKSTEPANGLSPGEQSQPEIEPHEVRKSAYGMNLADGEKGVKEENPEEVGELQRQTVSENSQINEK